MDRKAIYREFCESEPTLALFQQAWWLDATCGEAGWDVALVQKGEEVHAALPFRMNSRHGFTVLSQPPLTQFLGPWIRETGAKTANDYGRQKELMTALIEALPQFDQYRQNWSPKLTNWLPFFWQGFQQTTGYTYVLPELGEHAVLWQQFRENVRREIRRAEGRAGVVVDADGTIEEFSRLNELTFARQGRKRPYNEAYLRRLDEACANRGCRRIFVAKDSGGRSHAGAYIVWDAHKAYYLIGGGDPELRNSGAMSLCMWHAIQFATTVTNEFDFEGSMIEPIERFFRAFGARQVPYFRISRTPSRLLRGYEALKMMARG